jgi:outer membrane protein insertion porin family
MINLLALTLSGTLMAGSVNDAGFEFAQDALQREDSVRGKASGLLLKASRIEIEFVGNRFFSSSILLEQMRLTRDPEQSGRLTLKAPGNLESLEADLGRVRYFLGTHGFIAASIGEPKIEDLGDFVKVSVRIDERPRYRAGNIGVKGAKLLTPEQIIRISGLKTGAIVTATIIQENVFKGIRDIYENRGYIHVNISFLTDYRPVYPGALEGIVDITIEVDEGEVFFIRSVKFSGLVETDERPLQDLLLIREGDLFNRQMLNETLKRLNQLGLFEEILEKDVTTVTIEKDRQVELRIQVKEISRNL